MAYKNIETFFYPTPAWDKTAVEIDQKEKKWKRKIEKYG
jgi:hypothetical protein